MAQHRSATPDPIFRPPQDQRHTRKVSATTAKSALHLRNQRDNTLPRSAKLKNLIPPPIKDFFIF
jgi:hypothetical protein